MTAINAPYRAVSRIHVEIPDAVSRIHVEIPDIETHGISKGHFHNEKIFLSTLCVRSKILFAIFTERFSDNQIFMKVDEMGMVVNL